MGPQGIAGIQGEVGPRGESGTPGIQGEVGPAGAIGPPGVAGAPGIQGEVGQRGEPGAQGPEGKPSFYGRCLDTLSEVVAQEAAIVRHHAAVSKNFTGWFESWYPKRQNAMAAVLKRLGADESLAAEHCAESQSQLVALTERTTIEKLPADAEALTAAWHERAVVLSRRIAASALPNLPIDPGTLVSTPIGLGTVAAVQSDWRYQVECGDETKIMDQNDVEAIG